MNKDEWEEKHYGALGKTIDEILSHTEVDSDTLVDAIFFRLEKKSLLQSSYNDAELKFLEVYALVGEIGNGGFSQYFDNSSGDNAEIALAGLREIGADNAADITERAMAVFPDGKPPEDRYERQEIMEQMNEDCFRVWDVCSKSFCKLDVSVRHLLFVYANKRRAEIHLL